MSFVTQRTLLSHPPLMALPVALALLASATPAFATFRYVSSSGSNLGACKKANKPCLTMAYAVSKANANDTVWVQDSGVITRNVVIDKDLNIFGNGTTLRQLTAGGSGRHFEIDAGVVVRMANLELTAGSANNGGSILNAGRLTLLDCVLRDNTTTGRGGALWNQGELVVSRTTLDNNHALDGGGIANEEGGTLTVTNDSLLSDNHSDRHGGAIYLGEYSVSASIQRSALAGNDAGDSGGAVFAADGWFSVSDSTLDLNTADSSGGAIYTTVKLTLSRSSFASNEASQGGAILIAADDVHPIDHSSFYGNIAGGSGGAITATDGELRIDSTEFESNQGSVGGAIARLGYSSYSIDNSYFLSNQASNSGGAIADLTTFVGAPTHLTSSTFENNAATGGGWSIGGALARDTPSPGSVVNCTFFGNSAVHRGGAVHAGASVSGFYMANVTIASGGAAEGGAIFADASFEVRNSLLTASEDASLAHCAGVALTGVGNLVGTEISPSAAGWDSSCGPSTFSSVGATGVDTALGEHGGPTIGVNDVAMRTVALLAGSTARGKGLWSCDLPGAVALASDQRGLPRPSGGDACDVGAFEVQ